MGIGPSQVGKTRYNIALNLTEMVLENLAGQCQRDHSCKDETKDQLRLAIGMHNNTSTK